MPLTVVSFDNGKKMWQGLQSDWLETKGTLLLPGGFARLLFERGIEKTAWENRLYTLPEFWQELSKTLRLQEKVIASDLEEDVIFAATRRFPRLSLLSGSSLASLVSHLQKIEYEADQDFKPSNSLEEEIADLRDKLLEEKIYTQASFRTIVSRRAKEIDLGYDLLVTHLPEPSRQLMGMLKGLAQKNNVFYYPLMPQNLLVNYLREAGLEDGDYIAREEGGERPLSTLFSRETPNLKEEIEISLFSTAKEGDTALFLAHDLLSKGEKRIAIVLPGSERRKGEIIRLAREHGLPLSFRLTSEAKNTILGSLLLALTREKSNLQESWEGIREDASSLYHLTDQDRDRLLSVESEEFLQHLFLFAEGLLDQEGLPAREYLWFNNATKKLEALRDAGIKIEDEEAFLLSIVSPRKAYGEGVLLLSPAEVPSYKIDHLIFLSLSADEYPKQNPASPFFSRELLGQIPALATKDEKYTFASALLAAQKSISLLRDSRDEPSSYFAEVARLGFDEKYIDSDLPQTRIKKMARERKLASEGIKRALEQIAPDVSLDEESIMGKSDFSVTELERYLACPLGWFVERQISPRKRVNLNQRRGTALHSVLEELLTYDFSTRQELLPEVLTKYTEDFLSPRQRSFDEKSLLALLEKYSGPQWPFEEHHLEKFFSLETETEEGDLIEIKGRIDRLDVRQGPEGKEALLIDYKLNKAGEGNLLQISLYPLMAEANMGVEVLGFLYVSMMQGNHKGRLKRPIPGISDEGIRYPLTSDQGLTQAREAIKGIRSGDWFRQGKQCPSWCAHRLLSKTKENR